MSKAKRERRKAGAIVRDIRARLSVVRVICPPNCGHCCGPAYMSAWEWKRLPEKKKILKDMKCPYLEMGRCSIYKDRPIICRIYGVSPEHEKLGCAECVVKNPLSSQEVDILMQKYMQTCF